MDTTDNKYDFLGKTFFFGVETTYDDAQEKSIKYIISCEYVAYTEESEFIVQLDRKQFFINGKEPQKLVDQLADACMQTLYPIKCRITKEGQFVKFSDYEGLRKKWQQGIPKIRERYKGDATNAYLQQIADSLATEETANKALLKDVVYHLLFPSKLKVEKEMEYTFPTKPSLAPEVFYGTANGLTHETLFGIRFEGIDDSKASLKISHWWYKKDLSLCQTKVTYTNQDQSVNYTITRLKEREENSHTFYMEEKEEELQVEPLKKKKKWLLF